MKVAICLVCAVFSSSSVKELFLMCIYWNALRHTGTLGSSLVLACIALGGSGRLPCLNAFTHKETVKETGHPDRLWGEGGDLNCSSACYTVNWLRAAKRSFITMNCPRCSSCLRLSLLQISLAAFLLANSLCSDVSLNWRGASFSMDWDEYPHIEPLTLICDRLQMSTFRLMATFTRVPTHDIS